MDEVFDLNHPLLYRYTLLIALIPNDQYECVKRLLDIHRLSGVCKLVKFLKHVCLNDDDVDLHLKVEILNELVGSEGLHANKDMYPCFENVLNLYSGSPITIFTGVTVNLGSLTGQTVVTINEDYNNYTGEPFFSQLSGTPVGSTYEIIVIPFIPTPTPTPTFTSTPTPTSTFGTTPTQTPTNTTTPTKTTTPSTNPNSKSSKAGHLFIGFPMCLGKSLRVKI
jgi:hypothetical protein